MGAIDGIGLSLLAVARDAQHPRAGRRTGDIGRPALQASAVSASSYIPEDVNHLLLVQQGISDPSANQSMLQMSGPNIQGAGELWINDEGLPARLVLDLDWVHVGDEPYRTRVNSITHYSGFGQYYYLLSILTRSRFSIDRHLHPRAGDLATLASWPCGFPLLRRY